MGRRKVADIERFYINANVFFLTDKQEQILKTAIHFANIPQAYKSKAIVHALAITKICEYYTRYNPVK